MHVKSHLFGEDTETPDIDGAAATKSIAMYLYKAGKYEQWCIDWSKDPVGYWRQVYGQDYRAYKKAHPIPQVIKGAASAAADGKKARAGLFGFLKRA